MYVRTRTTLSPSSSRCAAVDGCPLPFVASVELLLSGSYELLFVMVYKLLLQGIEEGE